MHQLVGQWGCRRRRENKQSSLHLLHLHCTPLTDKSEWRLGQPVDIHSRRKLLLWKICLNKRNTAKKWKIIIPSPPSSYWSPICCHPHLSLGQKINSWVRKTQQAWPLRLNVKTKLNCSETQVYLNGKLTLSRQILIEGVTKSIQNSALWVFFASNTCIIANKGWTAGFLLCRAATAFLVLWTTSLLKKKGKHS